jgi:hypothetical protein
VLKIYDEENTAFSTKIVGKLDSHLQKLKLDLNSSLCTSINSKWMLDECLILR